MTRHPERAALGPLALLLLAAGGDAAQLQSYDQVYARVSAVHPRPEQLGPVWEATYARLRPAAAAAENNDQVAVLIETLLRTLPGRHHALIRDGARPRGDRDEDGGGDAAAPAGEAATAPGDLGPASGGTPAPAPRTTPTQPPSVQADSASTTPASAPVTRPQPPRAAAPRPWLPGEAGMPGLLPVAAQGAARVGWIAPGGPAEAAGLALGDVILEVDGAACPAAPACLAPELPPGGARALRVQPAAGGAPRLVQLTADQPRVALSPALGATPAMRTLTWGGPLPLASGGHAELIGVSVMSVVAGQQLHARLGRLPAEGARGLVIDLRENPGGLVQLSAAIGSYLLPAPTALGQLRTRADTLQLRTLSRAPTQRFDGPVAILVSEGTGSTSELLAGALQELGRARVFGAQTMGAVESALIEPLPNGDRLQLVIATIELPSGAALEGAGVRPDAPTPGAALRGATGRDPALEAALAWIDAAR